MRSVATIMNIYASMRVIVEQYDRRTGASVSGGDGTGFVLFNSEVQRNYLVTNRHLVDPRFRGEVAFAVDTVQLRGHYQPNDPSALPEPFHGQIDSPNFAFHPDETVDLALVSGPVSWLQGDSATPGLGRMSRFDVDMLARPSEVAEYLAAGEVIYTAGYPSVAGEVADRPLLVQGIVSSDPRFPAAIGANTLPHSVLCHSFSWGGMSGAPVVAPLPALTQSRIVGVNAGHVDLQGTSGGVLAHFVHSDRVLELLAAQGDQFAAVRLSE